MKRIVYVLAAALVVAAAGVVYRTYRGGSVEPGLAGEPSPAGRGPARVLLNEILFAPPEGQPQWVELVNVGGDAVALDGFALENHAREVYALPGSITMPAGSVLLVRFDGQQQVDGATVHATRTGFLERRSGSVTLTGPAGPQDLALWSNTGGPSFPLGRGGRIPELAEGSTLGRPPASVKAGPNAWTLFFPDEATPAARNNFPAVTGMMPLSGAILRASTPTLAWYGVPTAARYRIQVATDRSFASPAFDATSAASGPGLSTEQVTTTGLSPGRYLWRVQAIFGDADGQNAAFSRPSIFWVEAPTRAAAAPGRNWIGSFVASVLAAQPQSDTFRKLLPVPLILQRKDTALLSVEGDETGLRRWDGAWPLRVTPYCARASIAMIAAFFGGNLSQDRISYAGDKDWISGPRRDLNVLGGWEDAAIKSALTFALGAAPRLDFDRSQVAAYVRQKADLTNLFWTLHRNEIDAGFPILATTQFHAWVIVGYGEDERGKYFTLNDPAIGQYDWIVVPGEGVDDADLYLPPGGALSTSFFLPRGAKGRSDEQGVSRDSDGDGVMDFDETERFGTNSLAKDSDNDGINDKEEIRAWVFDEKLGYWPLHLWGDRSDQDYDKKPMAIDADSDGGGCLDGMEDTNGNGKHEPGLKEFYNFDKDDDACISGSVLTVHDTTSFLGTRQKDDYRESIQFSLREIDGAWKGRATLTYSFRMEQYVQTDQCGNSIVNSSEPYQYAVDVQADVKTAPDGTVGVLVTSPEGWQPRVVRIVSDCAGVEPYETDGPEIRISGELRNGVSDSRVDLPLRGYTGAIYIETHLRQSR